MDTSQHTTNLENRGEALTTRIRKEKATRFLRGWGIVNVAWQWFPDFYKDEDGVPNCLIIMGDGFPMIRVRLGADDQWRLDYVQRDETTHFRYPNPDDYAKCPDYWKMDVPFPENMVPLFLTALGLPLDTDPVSLMGSVVTEDQIVSMIVPFSGAE